LCGCPTDDSPSVTDQQVARMIAEMAADGLRVLAVAERELDPDQATTAAADPEQFEKLCRAQPNPVGLLGLADTARPPRGPCWGNCASGASVCG
jgi:cation-transporting P-type ATPase I